MRGSARPERVRRSALQVFLDHHKCIGSRTLLGTLGRFGPPPPAVRGGGDNPRWLADQSKGWDACGLSDALGEWDNWQWFVEQGFQSLWVLEEVHIAEIRLNLTSPGGGAPRSTWAGGTPAPLPPASSLGALESLPRHPPPRRCGRPSLKTQPGRDSGWIPTDRPL